LLNVELFAAAVVIMDGCESVIDTAASSTDAVCPAGRLVKSTAFELFDEDANTESPTVSQKSNHDNIGLLDFHFASCVRDLDGFFVASKSIF